MLDVLTKLMNESWRQGREKVTALVHVSGERGAVLGEGTVCRARVLSPVLLLSLDVSVNGLA